MEEIHCNIRGRVQVVMFRDFVQRRAKRLGLSGWVKNLDDGSVELVAQGEKHQLEKLLKPLKKGPILANVENVEVSWRKPKSEFESFQIIY